MPPGARFLFFAIHIAAAHTGDGAVGRKLLADLVNFLYS